MKWILLGWQFKPKRIFFQKKSPIFWGPEHVLRDFGGWRGKITNSFSVHGKDEEGLQGLVGELTGAISKIDGDVNKLQGEERNSVMWESLKDIGRLGSKGWADYFGISSWHNCEFNEADYRCGKPIWVSNNGSSGFEFKNLVILADTRLGDGIETWVTLDEKDMARLECNPKLLTFASLAMGRRRWRW